MKFYGKYLIIGYKAVRKVQGYHVTVNEHVQMHDLQCVVDEVYLCQQQLEL